MFLQGLQDKSVPPDQAQTMASALSDKGVPNALVEFPEEGHGFRQADNIERALEAELYFYGRVFGFTRSEEHTSELQSRGHLVCRLLLEKKKEKTSKSP